MPDKHHDLPIGDVLQASPAEVRFMVGQDEETGRVILTLSAVQQGIVARFRLHPGDLRETAKTLLRFAKQAEDDAKT